MYIGKAERRASAACPVLGDAQAALIVCPAQNALTTAFVGQIL